MQSWACLGLMMTAIPRFASAETKAYRLHAAGLLMPSTRHAKSSTARNTATLVPQLIAVFEAPQSRVFARS